LEDGKIAEEGRHQDLLGKRGLYYAMYQRQLQEDGNKNNTANLAVEKT
jgi:ABC-type transport system involved in cytochrome bd biosynthesis fused ATPase/permease subunit